MRDIASDTYIAVALISEYSLELHSINIRL